MDITQLKSISFEEIKAYLENYVKNMPDYKTKWKDFYEGSAGVTLIELAAGICSFLSFTSYMNRKDSLLDYSSLPSTINSIAATLGYVINRKSVAKLKIKFDSQEEVYWNRENPIGNWMGRDLVLLNNQNIKIGSNEIEVAIGTWETYTNTLTEVMDFKTLLVERDIDNNIYEAYINNNRIKVVKSAENLDKESVLMKTTNKGAYIIFGNGLFGIKYSSGQVFKLLYIKPSDLLENHYVNPDKINLNIKTVITSVTVVDTGSPEDDPSKLVTLAPGYWRTKGTIIQYTDIEDVASAYQGLVSASGLPRAGTCCSLDVWYLRQDEQPFTDDQKEDFRQYLVEHSLLGLDFYIHEPTSINVDIKMNIVVVDNAKEQEILSLLQAELNKMTKKLGTIFSVGNLLSIKHSDIVASYIDYPIKDKLADPSQYFRVRSLNVNFVAEKYRSDLRFGNNEALGYDTTI